MGEAVMGIGMGEGPLRALTAAQRAVSNPLLEHSSMHGARSIVVNITGGSDLSLAEASEATTFITRVADPEANVIYGIVTNEMLRNAVRVTVIATGFEAPAQNGNGVRADAATAAVPETSAKPANGNGAAEAHPPRVGFMRRMWRGRGATA